MHGFMVNSTNMGTNITLTVECDRPSPPVGEFYVYLHVTQETCNGKTEVAKGYIEMTEKPKVTSRLLTGSAGRRRLLATSTPGTFELCTSGVSTLVAVEYTLSNPRLWDLLTPGPGLEKHCTVRLNSE
jgi:hypothetical protein